MEGSIWTRVMKLSPEEREELRLALIRKIFVEEREGVRIITMDTSLARRLYLV